MNGTQELHRCDKCCEAFTWDELDAVVIPGYSLLCRPCIETVRSERTRAAEEGR